MKDGEGVRALMNHLVKWAEGQAERTGCPESPDKVCEVLCKFSACLPEAGRGIVVPSMQMNCEHVHRFPRSTAIPGQVSNAKSG